MKKDRQQKILELIEQYDIGTQEMLMEKLAEEGYYATQTTLSRDIRQLKLVKSTTGKGAYRYVRPDVGVRTAAPKISSSMTESIRKMQAAGNLIVVKTMSGMANAIAVCIDSLEINEIVGSVAGDDTILIVLPDETVARRVLAHMRDAFHFGSV
ncbi:MAG: arginine repressor [Clostridia bacterium]|nr:arginine repressor [Clostridia bacterium]